MSHQNDGDCAKCDQIFDRYEGFHSGLRSWFKLLQRNHPEAHISCAGRGELDQEAAVVNRVSKAHWGQSAHNVNAAIDIFEVTEGDPNIYRRDWFENVLAPALIPELKWYGEPGSEFFELPHVEVANWKALFQNGTISLVET